MAGKPLRLGQLNRAGLFPVFAELSDEHLSCLTCVRGRFRDFVAEYRIRDNAAPTAEATRAAMAAAGHGAMVAKMHSDCNPLDEIVPRLFLGTIGAAEDIPALRARGIKAVVNISGLPSSKATRKAAQVLEIDVMDMMDEDIISSFPAAVAFMKNAIDRGAGVFVHCFHGVSRSTSVVAAYLIASGQAASGHEAIALAQARRSCADPNESFREQLEVWAELGANLDGHSAAHAAARATAARRSRSKGMLWLESAAAEPRGDAVKCCAKCKRELFGNANVVRPAGTLVAAAGEGCADTSQTRVGNKPGSRRKSKDKGQNCGAAAPAGRTGLTAGGNSLMVAVEPLGWMNGDNVLVTQMDAAGKLNCPGCNAKLGHWSWGEMVGLTPAFMIMPDRLR